MATATGAYTQVVINGNSFYEFTGTGTISFPSNTSTDVLIVAGGGGGGGGQVTYESAGGGGAGGVGHGTLTFAAGVSYTITVGAGGTGGIYEPFDSTSKGSGTSGSNSSIVGGSINVVANGGGRGGSVKGGTNTAQAGGSSGGGAGWGSTVQNNTKGTGTGLTYLGNNGGTTSGPNYAGSGGGGAGSAGSSGVQNGTGGAGGSGFTWTPTNRTYGGGGGGGFVGAYFNNSPTAAGGAGGSGGGGAGGGSSVPTAGTAKTGGGGGGACSKSVVGDGAAGGSGVVYIRIITTPPSPPVISYANVFSNGSAIVSFTQTAATPAITNYYYSTNGGSSYTNTSVITSPIVITSLSVNSSYDLRLMAYNSSGNSTAAAVAVGNAPVIISITPTNLALTVSFSPSSGATATRYLYSIDGGATFVNSVATTTSPLQITNLTAGQSYPVSIRAAGTNWMSSNSAVFASTQPSNFGTTPAITGIVPGANALSVSFNVSTGAYPTPTYYYSNTGNVANQYFVLSTPAAGSSNTFVINNVPGTSRSVVILAVNSAGNLYSAASSQTPYYLGTRPNIISVAPQANALSVSFVATVGGNPTMVSGNYYYSIDGTNYSAANPTITGSTGPNTFVISGLTANQSKTVQMYSSSPAGNMYSINTPSQTPYVLGTTTPSITNIYSGLNSIIVQYSGPTDANPAPFYYYSLNTGTYANSSVNTTSGNITIPTTLNGNNTVQLMAVNPAGNIVSNSLNGRPYLVGTQPNIISVVPQANSLVVSFYLSVNGYTNPNYYYSTTGNTNPGSYILIPSANITLNPNTFVIYGLTANVAANVSLLALNSAGNVYSATTVLQTPYVIGNTSPAILQVYSNVNSLLVSFAATTNANPPPFYYYSVSGGVQNANSGMNSNVGGNLYIPNLSVYGNYAVSITAVSPAGNVSTENSYGIPYFLGITSPIITNVYSNSYSLTVQYTGPTDGNPAPYYYYSLNSGTYTNTNVNATSGYITIPTSVIGNNSVRLRAVNPLGNLESNQAYGQPYYYGSQPNIISVSQKYNALSVSFYLSVGGDASPISYYYSTTGSLITSSYTLFTATGTTSNTVVIPVYQANANISILAQNDAGNVYSATTVIATPYLIGNVYGGSFTQFTYNYIGYTFNSNTGNITFPVDTTANVLIVAGGGGGGCGIAGYGASTAAGGGGAGGVGIGTITFKAGIIYNITVGSGGAGGTGGLLVDASNGGNSLIVGGTISEIAYGGGYGAYNNSTSVGNGGSGGGQRQATNSSNSFATKGSGSLTYYGSAGGRGYSNGSGSGGGGGGAGEPGQTQTTYFKGATGGNGITWSFTGYYYGGGGGAGAGRESSSTVALTYFGNGGLGGGGRGGGAGPVANYAVNATSGAPNTGGGGGGAVSGSIYAANLYGGNGGSGIVMLTFSAPLSVGTDAPIITSIVSGINLIRVNYTGSVGANPPPYYYYSVNGNTFSNTGYTTNTSIVISNITTTSIYTVQLMAVNPSGNVLSGNASGQAYILGTQPNIISVVPQANSLVVSFYLSVNGYTNPNYYYSTTGNTNPGSYILIPSANITLNPNTFVIYGLTANVVANVALLATNPAGNVYSTTTVLKNPYVLGTNAPNIFNVYGNVNSLLVSFAAVQNAYPPPFYYYSVSGGAQNANSGLNSNVGGNLYIPNINVLGNYTITITAVNPAGNVVSNSANGQPYIIGSQPNIISVVPGANSVSASINLSTGGNPVPTYYYSVSGNVATTYSLANPQPNVLNANTIVITGLTVNVAANVSAVAVIPGANVYSATTVLQTPYVLGTAVPNITSLQSNLNSLIVSFTGSVGANPTPYYYYSVNGTAFANTGLNTNTTFTILDLTVANVYTIQLMAVNPAGNLRSGNLSGRPYVVGTQPTITSINGNFKTLSVAFQPSTGAYPTPYYYYSLDNGTSFSNSFSNASPFSITTFNPVNSYNVSIIGVSIAGNTTSSSQITLGNIPVISSVVPGNLSLIVSFVGSAGANSYNYSIDGGATFGNAGTVINSNITIVNVSSLSSYSVALQANGITWYMNSNAYSPVQPYGIGNAPIINTTGFNSTLNAIVVGYSVPVGANPAPTVYYYSVNGGSTYLNANANLQSNTFSITGLAGGLYPLTLIAQNAYGNTLPSTSFSAEFDTIGSKPVITNVLSGMDIFVVSFTDPVGGYPAPFTYYYSVNGGNTYANANTSSSPMYIYGNYSDKSYPLTIIAQNILGNTLPSNQYNVRNYDPSGVDTFSSNLITGGTSTITYTSVNITSGTYNLKTVGGTTLQSQVVDQPLTIIASSNLGGNGWAIAASSTGNIYVQRVSTNVIYVYNSSGTYLNVSISPSRQFICTAKAPAANTIWWGGDRFFSELNTTTNTFTHYTVTPNIWGMCYNPADGYVYTSNLNALQIHKLNPTDRTSSIIFDNASAQVSGMASASNFFEGVAIGYDGNLYCITRNEGKIWKFTTSGTSLGLFASLPGTVSGLGLWFNSNLGVFYAQISSGPIYQITSAGYVSLFSGAITSGVCWGTYFDPSLNKYYTNNGTNVYAFNTLPITLSLSFSDSLLATNTSPLQLYNEATSFGLPIQTLGSAPYITGVSPIVNGLSVSFNASVGALPKPFYYYSVDGVNYSNSFVYSNASSITIPTTNSNTYTVYLRAVSPAGNVDALNTASAASYVVGTRPNIINMTRIGNSFSINFYASVGGNPDPYYYYSVNGNIGYANTNSQSNITIITPNLSGNNYSVSIMAVNTAGNVYSATPFLGIISIIGSNPTVNSVSSLANGLSVSFQPSTGGYPAPTYYYSLNGGSTYSTANIVSQTANSMVIGNMFKSAVYSVAILARNIEGDAYSGNAISGQPYVIGTAPNITSVVSYLNNLSVSFTGSTGGYPNVTAYYYSLNGAANYVNANTTASPFIISNVSTGSYSITLLAQNLVGNTSPSAAYSKTVTSPTIGSSVKLITDTNVQRVCVANNFLYYQRGSNYNVFYKYNLYGSLASTITFTGITSMKNMCYVKNAGQNGRVYMCDYAYSSSNVQYIDCGNDTTGVITISISGTGQTPCGVATDGSYLYFINNSDVRVYKCDFSGNYLSTIRAAAPLDRSSGGQGNSGIACDGTYIYIGDSVGFTNAGTVDRLEIAGTNTLTLRWISNSSVAILSAVEVDANFIYVLSNANNATIYQYSLITGGSTPTNTFVVSGMTGSSITTITSDGKYLYASNGTDIYQIFTNPSPYIGNSFSINSVSSLANALSVNINLSTGGWPSPIYYYSISGNANPYYAVNPPLIGNANTFQISNLTTYTGANVSVLALYSVGNVYSTNTIIGNPYVVGNALPNITSVQSNANSLIVSFAGSVGAYPQPFYYYSVNGNTFSNTGLNANTNFVIQNLTTANTYSIRLMAVNPAGNLISGNVSGQPYVLGTALPNITKVQSNANSLTVSFTGAVGAYTQPFYYYSVNGSVFSNTGLTSNTTFTIPGLTTIGIYSIQLMSVNPAGNLISGNVSGQPYVIGTAIPNITQVVSGINRLTIQYTGAQNAYPNPYYYYSVNGNDYANSGFNTNANIVVSNLYVSGNYQVSIMSVSPAGNLISGNASGQPYVLGTQPNILNAYGLPNAIAVAFETSTSGYPAPSYYYSVDSGNTYIPANIAFDASSLIIGNLFTSDTYGIRMMALNAAGNVYSENTVSASPFVLGSAPYITSVVSALNSLVVVFNASVGTTASYYYSVDGEAFVNAETQTNIGNITIQNLNTAKAYSIQIMATNPAGNLISNTVQGTPFIRGSRPDINSVSSLANALSVSFQPSTGGYPPPTYYYTVDGGSSFINTNVDSNANSFVIGNLTTLQVYNVSLLASNSAGNVESSASVSGQPYTLGTQPNITSVASIANGLSVSFQASTGGYTDPVYYYSINGGNTYFGANVDQGTNSFIIDNLKTATTYGVQLLASNPAGNLVSNSVSGEPYVLGTSPQITRVSSNVNSLDIEFSASSGAYPLPQYYYSVNQAEYVDAGVNSNANIITIPGLNLANIYTVSLLASNPAGNLISNTVSGEPYVVGSDFQINVVDSSANSLVVYFDSPSDWNPTPFYYYSIDGTTYANTQLQSNSQPFIIENLYSATQYLVMLRAQNVAGLKYALNTYSAIPYVLGTQPVITSVESAYNSLIVQFAASYGGNPDAQYYYSVDGQGFVDSGTNSNYYGITITGLTNPTSYNIQLMGSNSAGNLYSNTSSGIPYVLGTKPTISAVNIGIDSLSLDFNASTGGYPTPYYYYSVDGTNYANSGLNSNATPLLITGLNSPRIYTIYLKAVSIAGNTDFSTGQGEPYVVGTAPVITNIDSSLNKLIVAFTDSMEGNPSPTSHYYSIDGGATYVNAGPSTSPIIIENLTVAQTYSVVLIAVNAAGNTAPSNVYDAQPYVIGSSPIITNVESGINQLSLSFAGPIGGYPEPTTYYYSINGGASYVDSLTTVSPIIIPNLYVAASYPIKLIANNLGGNTVASNTFYGQPYVIGSSPNITSVDSGVNQISISFTGSVDGYPEPSTYLYSLDGGNTFSDSQTNVSPIVVSDLYTAQTYPVALIAVNTAGQSAVSNVVDGKPYVIGTGLFINSVASGINSLSVGFDGLTGGYPDPNAYYYSVDGGSYVLANVLANTKSFVIGGLTQAKNYSITLIAHNLAGNTNPTSPQQGVPYVVGNPATINSVLSGINQLSVYYTPATSLYPAPTTYYYSMDRGNTYVDANTVANPIIIRNLYDAVNYPITIIAHNSAGNTAASNVVYGEPYVAGTMPNITSIVSLANSLSVSFQASEGAYPTPFYYYSVDGGLNYVNSEFQSNASPIIITDLFEARAYTVSIKAVNAWGDLSGSSATGEPYVIGTKPSILDITPGTNTLTVQFQGSINDYPAPYYYYSTDGGSTYSNSNVNTDASPIVIPNLTVATIYNVSIMAVNFGGNTASDSVQAEPYVIGTQPYITALTPGTNAIAISFSASTNAYPTPYYYYSVNGSDFSNSQVNSNSGSILLTGLTSPNLYTISLKGISVAGNTATSVETGHSYVFGSIPVINSVSSATNSLIVSFQLSTGGYPLPTAYYYSIDGGITYLNGNTTTSPMTIPDLTVVQTYYIQLIAENAAGSTQPSLTASGEPYVIGSAPIITDVSSIPYGVSVSFLGTTDGYPDPTTYYYSVDGGNTYASASGTASPFFIHNLNEFRSYPITLKAHNLIGNTSPSQTAYGTPYIRGSTPVISSVASVYNGLSINFSESAGGNPSPSSYFYSLDGGATFTDSGAASSPIIVSGLTTPTIYSVAVQANNLAGNTATSNIVQGEPYVIGTAPQISNVSSIYNGLSVSFSGSTGGYPSPSSYYYSLDGGATFTDSLSNSSPILITGLTTATVYSVALLANSAAGQSAASNVVQGEPYVIGSRPTNVQVTSILNGLSVSFTASTDGYPSPSSYFYSLDGGSTFTDSLRSESPLTIANLSTPTQYSVVLYANSIAGRSQYTSAVLATPYVIGKIPNISSISSGYNSITVDFSPSTGGYPEPATYYYSIDGGTTFVDAATTATPITIQNLTSANAYSVCLKAGSVAGNTEASNLVAGRAYVIGSAPNISSVSSVLNGVSVNFSGSADGYPSPSTYYYSIDGGQSFADALSNISPIVISGLTNLSPYSIALLGVNSAWPSSTATSNVVDGQPYVIGIPPTIDSVASLSNSLSVSFTASTQGYPNPSSYFYSLDGGNTFTDSLSTTSPIITPNLSVAKTYNVVLYATSVAGNTGASNSVPGNPYVLGTVPVISNIASLPYAMSVSFTGSLNGYPEPSTYFYSINGGNTYINSLSNSSPILISFQNLAVPNIYSVRVYASGIAGNTEASSAVSGRPYIAGSAPIISNVLSLYNGLSVSFTGSTGGYPDPTNYLYSSDNGATYRSWGNVTEPIIINGLTTATQYYVKLIAVNAAGNSLASSVGIGTPLVIGTAPTITAINSVVDGISIVYNPPQNSYPAPTTYYYSLDGGNTFTNALSTANPLNIGNLTTPTIYSVSLYAVNEAGNTLPSASVSGSPYIVGSAPQISNVVSGYNSITINFVGSTGSSQSTAYYFYSLNGGQTFANSRLTSSPIVVSGLTSPIVYSVVLYSVSAAGQSANSTPVNGIPYVIGTAPVIQSVQSIPGGMAVYYSAPQNAYPSPTNYYYSLNNGTYVNANSIANPLLITGLIYTGNYSVRIYAASLAGNTPSSAAVTGKPYILGSVPSIIDIVPGLNKLTINFNPSTGGYPAPTTYYYSVDGLNYLDSLQTVSPLVITGLTQAMVEHVSIKAGSLAGNTAASNLVDSEPFEIGTVPVITRIVPGINRLSVYFSASTGGNPVPSTYLYSIDGTQYVDSGQSSNATPIIITGLERANSYPVYLVAQSDGGLLTAPSLPVYGIPYIQGSAPTINSVEPIAGSSGTLSVSFELSVGGYPSPSTYYYSLDGGTTYQDSRSVSSPITIRGLSLQENPYLITLSAHSIGWDSPPSIPVPGIPYIVGSPIVVNGITPLDNGLSVAFTDSSGGYPSPTTYYYTLNGGNTFAISGNTESPVVIGGLTVANTYSVGLIAGSLGGNTRISNLVSAIPNVIGAPPVISSVLSGSNSLSVVFSPPVGGNPAPTAYYYSLDLGNTYINANTTTSPFTIGGLYESRPYQVQLVAQNAMGNTASSEPVQGEPYTVGGNIVIGSVSSILNGLTVQFTKPSGWNPALTTYYYSLDGINYVLADSSSSPITIRGLTVATQHIVSLRATNVFGVAAGSNAILGEPWVVGTAPTIQRVYNVLNGISVSFVESQGGYPAPSTYLYSIDGGNIYLDSGTNKSPVVITGISGEQTYAVSLKAVNTAGTSAVSNTVSGNTYVVGNSPTITGVQSILNGLIVAFTPPAVQYATPITYMYSLDGVNYIDTGATTSPLTIRNLTVAGSYNISIKGVLQLSNVSAPFYLN